MAFGLLCTSATFAVWTSGGGLETRQFTLLILVAVVCLSLWRSGGGLVAASLSLALAAGTRPEGLLTGLVCIGWFALQSMADAGRPRPDWRRLAWLAVPFLALVTAHYLFRHAYYGEWLPNTYYAKHVRPWYESGFRYLWAAALETGLYLLLPLAVIAARNRWRTHRDGVFALPLLLVGVHMAYVMRVGGDHFEYRPLDFYWPLLALPAAAGIAQVGSRLAAGRWRPASGGMRAQACAVAVFVPVLFYAGAIQGALLFEGAVSRERSVQSAIELDAENAGGLLRVPGMPMLIAISNDLRRLATRQHVAIPFFRHRDIAASRLRAYQEYAHMARGLMPADALMDSAGVSASGIGIRFYYLADLNVIDRFGLTDATVARNPVTAANRERKMAHDRRPPPGYLKARGVNIAVHPVAHSRLKALMWGQYAVQIGPGLWMPFDAPDEQWVRDRFAGRGLQLRSTYYASLSWENAAPDFDYRTGDLGFVITAPWHLPWVGPRAQVFARKCAPDELLSFPGPDQATAEPTPQRWTVSATGLCRATASNRNWITAAADDRTRLNAFRREHDSATGSGARPPAAD